MSTEHEQTSIGRWMIAAAWILCLLLLTLVFGDFLEQQHNPNQSLNTISEGESRSVVLQQNRFGHYVATGTINKQPVVFMLDTGATSVSVPAPIAQRLQLEKGYANVVNTANGTITVYSTLLDQVGLGAIELNQVRAHINPHMDGEEILLGMSFLKQLAFSQQGDKLTLTQSIPISE